MMALTVEINVALRKQDLSENTGSERANMKCVTCGFLHTANILSLEGCTH